MTVTQSEYCDIAARFNPTFSEHGPLFPHPAFVGQDILHHSPHKGCCAPSSPPPPPQDMHHTEPPPCVLVRLGRSFKAWGSASPPWQEGRRQEERLKQPTWWPSWARKTCDMLRRTRPTHSPPPPRIAPCGLVPGVSPAKLPGNFARVCLSRVSWSSEGVPCLPCVAARGRTWEKRRRAWPCECFLAGTTRQDPSPCAPSLSPHAHTPTLIHPPILTPRTALVVWCVRSA